ncbi:MAG: hypothetical protein WBK24_01360 [Dethiobacteria bacterium]|jgi:hypothetical protein|nr:hypothetical protein [Bacillota bacterium]HOA36449.1 hypothetical protein [Bacillota bacterium]HOJ84803.1 hypothetical protein [Bacillota bacterium]HOL15048.1 hypothetical protein [Bacillota bacterium]
MKYRKRLALKYFKPVNSDEICELLLDSDDSLEESFGHFALQKKSGALFLNRFGPDEIMALMEKVGLVEHLHARGFRNLQLEIMRDEVQNHHLKVYDGTIDPENLLINLRLSRSRFVPDQCFFNETKNKPVLDMVMIEWLSAEDPRAGFTPGRPQLPGQSRPGLGSLRHLIEIMYITGRILMVDGFMDVPEHFHGAVMYSQKFKFFDPVQEAVLQAILRDLKEYSLHDLSWGMLTKSIVDSSTGRPEIYIPSEQVFPISRHLNKYYNSKLYRNSFMQAYGNKKYTLDYEAMLERKNKLLRNKRIEDL